MTPTGFRPVEAVSRSSGSSLSCVRRRRLGPAEKIPIWSFEKPLARPPSFSYVPTTSPLYKSIHYGLPVDRVSQSPSAELFSARAEERERDGDPDKGGRNSGGPRSDTLFQPSLSCARSRAGAGRQVREFLSSSSSLRPSNGVVVVCACVTWRAAANDR